MSPCYFCEFCDFIVDGEFTPKQLLLHIKENHECNGFEKQGTRISCLAKFHFGSKTGNENICTKIRPVRLMCCVCEKTYKSIDEYINCLNVHAIQIPDDDFMEQVEEAEFMSLVNATELHVQPTINETASTPLRSGKSL